MNPVLTSLIAAYQAPVSPAKLHAKLDIDGNELPGDSTEHVALIDYRLGLLIDVRDDRRATQREAIKLAAKTDLFGIKTWRLQNDVEAFLTADRTRYMPAADPSLYPNAKPERYWTSTVDPESELNAFAVYLVNGDAFWYYRGFQGVVRAVCPLVPPPGQ